MKPVTDLYSSECPVCGGQKRVMFMIADYPPPGERVLFRREAAWGESPSGQIERIECFCAHCGIKFIYPF